MNLSFSGVENAATSSGQGLAAEKEEANTMETFRDFVEKIVVGLIGNMDVPINRVVYHHSPCKLKRIEILHTSTCTRIAIIFHSNSVKILPCVINSFFFFLFEFRNRLRKEGWND